jgi:probable rRNA maturation factor
MPEPANPVAIDVLVEAGDWAGEGELEALAATTIATACAELQLAGKPSELSIVFTDDLHIRELNKGWRGKDKATNVLSFPASQTSPRDPLPPMLGDIVIAFETVRREAELEGKAFDHHLTHLIVHGFLHLLGYDHETDPEAEIMERTEARILARLAIADPYALSDTSD